MNLTKLYIRSFAMAGAFLASSCSKTNIEDVIIDVEQPTQITTYYDYSLIADRMIGSGLDQTASFTPYSMQLNGNLLYIGNRASQRVEVYDLNKNKYVMSYQNGDRTDPLDIAVDNKYVYVACGNFREVQIFDKSTGNYLTRLGTGTWTGNVSYATGICLSDNLVFIRDSKEGVRVFDMNSVNQSATNNNGIFSNLAIDGINSSEHAVQHSMQVLDGNLYAFDIKTSTLYVYSVAKIKNKETGYEYKVTFTSDMMPTSFDVDRSGKLLYFSVTKDGKKGIIKIRPQDVRNYPWSKYEQFISYNDDSRRGMKLHNKQFIYSYASRLQLFDIRTDSVRVITPIK